MEPKSNTAATDVIDNVRSLNIGYETVNRVSNIVRIVYLEV